MAGVWPEHGRSMAGAVSSGYSYTGCLVRPWLCRVGGDNPACALQVGLMIRIELYRETRIRTRLIPTAYSSFRVDIHFCRVRLPPPPSKRGLGGEANIER